MDAQAFAWWLHGWSEINGGAVPTAVQWQIINDHLDLVFNKVTPDRQPHGAPPAGRAPSIDLNSYTGHPPITGDRVVIWSGLPGVMPFGSSSPIFIC